MTAKEEQVKSKALSRRVSSILSEVRHVLCKSCNNMVKFLHFSVIGNVESLPGLLDLCDIPEDPGSDHGTIRLRAASLVELGRNLMAVVILFIRLVPREAALVAGCVLPVVHLALHARAHWARI
jgi:hypothetical protein